MRSIALWMALLGSGLVATAAGGCASTQPECFECGLSDEWDRVERERERDRERERREAAREQEAEPDEAGGDGEEPGSGTADPGCTPVTTCPMGSRGSRCGEMGCPGAKIHCGCQWGLTCQGGACMPAHRACDPRSPKDVCPDPVARGGACGAVPAGCPGVTVHCACASGLRCEDGRCQ